MASKVLYAGERIYAGMAAKSGICGSIKKKGRSVVRDGTSLNSYVNGKELPIVDSYYDTAKYFIVKGQPGMIYYTLERKKKTEPEPALIMSTKKAEARTKSRVRGCEPKKIGRPQKQPVTWREQLGIGQWSVETPLDASWEQDALNILHDNYDSYGLPYRRINGKKLGSFSSWPDKKLIEDTTRNTGIALIGALLLELFWSFFYFLCE